MHALCACRLLRSHAKGGGGCSVIVATVVVVVVVVAEKETSGRVFIWR